MATSGKVDLRSPSTSWKEAKKFLKDLDTKKRREQYGAKDYKPLKDIQLWKDLAKKLKIKPVDDARYPKNKDLNEKICLFQGDITKLEVDAIVNAGRKTQRPPRGGQGHVPTFLEEQDRRPLGFSSKMRL